MNEILDENILEVRERKLSKPHPSSVLGEDHVPGGTHSSLLESQTEFRILLDGGIETRDQS
jgi:hypothetical protein